MLDSKVKEEGRNLPADPTGTNAVADFGLLQLMPIKKQQVELRSLCIETRSEKKRFAARPMKF
jgi:hypothetical protein